MFLFCLFFILQSTPATSQPVKPAELSVVLDKIYHAYRSEQTHHIKIKSLTIQKGIALIADKKDFVSQTITRLERLRPELQAPITFSVEQSWDLDKNGNVIILETREGNDFVECGKIGKKSISLWLTKNNLKHDGRSSVKGLYRYTGILEEATISSRYKDVWDKPEDINTVGKVPKKKYLWLL